MSGVHHSDFGRLPCGTPVSLHTLKNDTGMEVSVMDYGATIQKWIVPDSEGKGKDIALGFANIENYLNQEINPYFGCTVGRFANRIKGGCLSIDDHRSTINEAARNNTLHGGSKGFDKRMWSLGSVLDTEDTNRVKAIDGVRETEREDLIRLSLSYISADGEEGFPGTLNCTVDFLMNRSSNVFRIRYRAVTDQRTVINLTNHTYFNLEGHNSGTHLDQEMQIFADKFIPIDLNCIPSGEILEVKGTPFDFTAKKKIGRDIFDDKEEQISIAKGFDHCFLLENEGLKKCSKHEAKKSGIVMEISTTQIGCQFYAGNWIPENNHQGKEGCSYGIHSGFAMETQSIPNSMNFTKRSGGFLLPGQTYDHSTVYEFTVL